MKTALPFIIIALSFVGCLPQNQNEVKEETTLSHVLKIGDVEPLSADEVIERLVEGNERFTTEAPLAYDALNQLKESAIVGQSPMAIVLSCIDSRVPVEILFDMSVGDIFVARVAGNVVSGDVLGSMEYACEHAGSKVVMVLGHESCGAVHAACEGVEAGNMTDMLSKIKPAISRVAAQGGDKHSAEFQNRVVIENVKGMIEEVRSKSHILEELEREGKIKIVGGVFSLESGEVEVIETI